MHFLRLSETTLTTTRSTRHQSVAVSLLVTAARALASDQYQPRHHNVDDEQRGDSNHNDDDDVFGGRTKRHRLRSSNSSNRSWREEGGERFSSSSSSSPFRSPPPSFGKFPRHYPHFQNNSDSPTTTGNSLAEQTTRNLFRRSSSSSPQPPPSSQSLMPTKTSSPTPAAVGTKKQQRRFRYQQYQERRFVSSDVPQFLGGVSSVEGGAAAQDIDDKTEAEQQQQQGPPSASTDSKTRSRDDSNHPAASKPHHHHHPVIFSGARRVIELYATLRQPPNNNNSSRSSSDTSPVGSSSFAADNDNNSNSNNSNNNDGSNFFDPPDVTSTATHTHCTCRINFAGISVEEQGLSRDEAADRAYSSLLEIALQALPGIAELEKIVAAHPDFDVTDISTAVIHRSLLNRIASINMMLGPPTKEDEEELRDNSNTNNTCTIRDGSYSVPEDHTASSPSQLKMERAARGLRTHLLRGRHQENSSMMNDNSNSNSSSAEDIFMMQRLRDMRNSPRYLEHFAASRAKLPMATKKQEILDLLETNRVVVICGTTGCGKTTQVPQYILDHHIETVGDGAACSILVTQPRRISAMTIASRMAQERCEPVGMSVGYTIRLDSRPGKNVTLLTTGVLLQLIRVDPALTGVKYLIIDEIHERDLNCDFTLILAREALKLNPELKLICMSATLQSETFSKYFDGAPIVNVDGMLHPVKEIYLEDLPALAAQHQVALPMFSSSGKYMSATSPSSSAASSSSSTSFGLSRRDVRSIRNRVKRNYIMKQNNSNAGMDDADDDDDGEDDFDGSSCNPENVDDDDTASYLPSPEKVDTHLIACAVELAIRQLPQETSILIFVAGWKEITATQDALRRLCPFSSHRHEYVLLHSSVTKEQQMLAFQKASSPEKVKIVIATNIAESGVTIPDVGAVIDSGVIRMMNCVMKRGTSRIGREESGSVFRLRTDWASKANITQRRGRAGRTQGGLCFRLFTRRHFENLPDFQAPEMLRAPLENVILQSIAMGHKNPDQFFSKAIDVPSPRLLKHSLAQLRALGAIHYDDDVNNNNNNKPHHNNSSYHCKLTWLGKWLVKMPTEPATAKMILLGATLGCLDPILTVAAASDAPPLATSMALRGQVRKARQQIGLPTLSDSVTDAVIVNSFFGAGQPQPPPSAEPIPRELFHTNNLRVLSRYKQQFYDILVDSGWQMNSCPSQNIYASFSSDDYSSRYYSSSQYQQQQQQQQLQHNSNNSNSRATTSRLFSSSSRNYFVDYSNASVFSNDIELVKAIVAAGLYPNVATLRQRQQRNGSPSSAQQRTAAGGDGDDGCDGNSSWFSSASKIVVRTKLRPNIAVSANCVMRPVLSPSKKALKKAQQQQQQQQQAQDNSNADSDNDASCDVQMQQQQRSSTTNIDQASASYICGDSNKSELTSSLVMTKSPSTSSSPHHNDQISASPLFVFESVCDIGGSHQREFLENVTHTNLFALLIFAGDAHITFYEDLNLGIIDGWILFKTDRGTIEALKILRASLNRCFGRLLREVDDNQQAQQQQQQHPYCRYQTADHSNTLLVLDRVRHVIRDLVRGSAL